MCRPVPSRSSARDRASGRRGLAIGRRPLHGVHATAVVPRDGPRPGGRLRSYLRPDDDRCAGGHRTVYWPGSEWSRGGGRGPCFGGGSAVVRRGWSSAAGSTPAERSSRASGADRDQRRPRRGVPHSGGPRGRRVTGVFGFGERGSGTAGGGQGGYWDVPSGSRCRRIRNGVGRD